MTSSLTTIHLVGSLGRAVGHHKLEMDVYSVAEAIHAIDIVTNGKLSRYLSGPGKDKFYKIAIQKRDNLLSGEELTHRSGRSPIFIIPTIRGRNSGAAKIIAGVALIALTYGAAAGYLGPALGNFVGAGALGGGGTLTLAGTISMGFGVSLLLGGITQLLTPKVQGPTANEEMAQSTSFQGNSTAVVQGGPVPVVYGRALMPAIPISISINNDNQPITDAGVLGDVDQTELEGGGIENSTGG